MSRVRFPVRPIFSLPTDGTPLQGVDLLGCQGPERLWILVPEVRKPPYTQILHDVRRQIPLRLHPPI
jgi:hypothetical protein